MKNGLNQINAFVMNSQFGETVPLSVTQASGSVTFALLQSARNYDVIVTNAGSNIAFINFGKTTATATVPGTSGTTGATPVLPGAIYTFQKNSSPASHNDTCAAICSSGLTTTLYFTSVQGS